MNKKTELTNTVGSIRFDFSSFNRNCKERSNMLTYTCDLFILLRDGIAFCPTSLFFILLSAKRVTVTRRIKIHFLHIEIRRVNGESPVSNSKSKPKPK